MGVSINSLVQHICCKVDNFRIQVESRGETSSGASNAERVGVADGKVEGTEDGVDQVNLGVSKGGEETDLGVEENAEQRGEKLGDDDGGEDSQEEGEETQDFVEVKEFASLVGDWCPIS